MIDILKEVAEEVRKAVAPLKGTAEAEKFVKMGADGEPTVQVDDVAERAAFGVLENSGVPMVVLSEESGLVRIGEGPEYICVLDPLDGTYNAVHNIPFYSVSIALARYRENPGAGDIEAGLVMNLETGDVFEARKGMGARFNSENISTSRDKNLDESTFSIYIQDDVKGLERLLKGVKRIRNMGSVALELCHVAKGDYQGFVDLRSMLKIVDVAAGKLIVEEAGGIVSNGAGNALDASILGLDRISAVACGSEELHRDVSRLLKDGKD